MENEKFEHFSVTDWGYEFDLSRSRDVIGQQWPSDSP